MSIPPLRKLVTLCCSIYEVKWSLLITCTPRSNFQRGVVVSHLAVVVHFLFIPGDVNLIIFLRLMPGLFLVQDRKQGLTVEVASFIVIHSKIVYDRMRRHVVFFQWVFIVCQTKKPCQNVGCLPVLYFFTTQNTLREKSQRKPVIIILFWSNEDIDSVRRLMHGNVSQQCC